MYRSHRSVLAWGFKTHTNCMLVKLRTNLSLTVEDVKRDGELSETDVVVVIVPFRLFFLCSFMFVWVILVSWLFGFCFRYKKTPSVVGVLSLSANTHGAKNKKKHFKKSAAVRAALHTSAAPPPHILLVFLRWLTKHYISAIKCSECLAICLNALVFFNRTKICNANEHSAPN